MCSKGNCAWMKPGVKIHFIHLYMYFKNCECVSCDNGQIKTAVTIQYLVLDCVCVVYVCDKKSRQWVFLYINQPQIGFSVSDFCFYFLPFCPILFLAIQCDRFWKQKSEMDHEIYLLVQPTSNIVLSNVTHICLEWEIILCNRFS